jgi:hypothetical protein
MSADALNVDRVSPGDVLNIKAHLISPLYQKCWFCFGQIMWTWFLVLPLHSDLGWTRYFNKHTVDRNWVAPFTFVTCKALPNLLRRAPNRQLQIKKQTVCDGNQCDPDLCLPNRTSQRISYGRSLEHCLNRCPTIRTSQEKCLLNKIDTGSLVSSFSVE